MRGEMGKCLECEKEVKLYARGRCWFCYKKLLEEAHRVAPQATGVELTLGGCTLYLGKRQLVTGKDPKCLVCQEPIPILLEHFQFTWDHETNKSFFLCWMHFQEFARLIEQLRNSSLE